MKSTLLLCLLLSLFFYANGQQIEACDDPATAEMESFCGSACVLCDLDGYTDDNNLTELGEAPPGFCAGGLHNTQWIGFVAGSVDLTIEIKVFDCTVTNDGLQIGIYNTTDCENYNLVSNCEDQVPPGPAVAFSNTVPLVPGGIYYLVIDGFNGDICDYSVDVTEGSATAPTVNAVIPQITAPLEGCPGEAVDVSTVLVDGAGAYFWTLDGEEVGTDNETNIFLPLEIGTYELCVLPYNPCSQGMENCTTIDVVTPETNVWEEVTICEGDVYETYGMEFSEEGQYNFIVPTINECPDVVQLDLHVDLIPYITIDTSLCAGVGLAFNGFVYYDPGVYNATLVGPNGCDSVVTINLTVLGDGGITGLIEEICDGEVFEVANEELTETGSYFFIMQDQDGCDSLIDVFLDVLPADDELIQEIICEGESYPFYGTNYTTPGIYTTTTQNVHGCTIEAILDLSINDTESITIDASICDGQSYTVGNNQYTDSGTYENTFMTSNGCDSVVTLNLEVLQNLIQTDPVTICEGDTIFLGSQAYFSSGTYDNDYISTEGCDSIYQLILTVLNDVITNISPSICAGSSFAAGGQTFATAGLYEVVLDANNGCDSIVMVDLTIEDELMGSENLTLCDGESITIEGQLLNTTGVYNFSYITADGCDSLHQLDLTILPAINNTINPVICTGTVFQIGNESFDTPGIYQVTLQAADGCDSVVMVDLVIEDQLTSSENLDICEGGSITIEGQVLNSAGVYDFSYTTADGCDSLHQINLTILPPPINSINPVICTGSVFQIGNENFDTPGVYQVTLQSADGCDSLVTVNLGFSDEVTTSLVLSICDGDTSFITNIPYTTTGDFEELLVADNGCDSIVQLALTVIPVATGTVDAVVCAGETYTLEGQVFDASGLYEIPLSSVDGCDSLIQLDLTVLPGNTVSIDESICMGQTYTIGGQVFDQTGVYPVTLIADNGCDSIVTVNLTVSAILIETASLSICEGESITVGADVYSTTGFYENAFITSTGCDSLYQLDLSIIPTTFSTINPTICDGEIFAIGSSNLIATGSYEEILLSTAGCDSVVTINLAVAPNPEILVQASICEDGSYTVGDSTITEAGLHAILLSSALGCDSTVMLDLTVTDFYETNLNVALCEGEEYLLGATSYDETGIYQTTFTAQDGCDSIVNLDLVIQPLLTTSIDVAICDGETYSIAGVPYQTTGIHTEMIPSVVTGCDSTITLNLEVNPVFEMNLSQTICDGESVQIGDITYVASGLYATAFVSQNNCDSIVMLDLEVIPVPEVFLIGNVCEGEMYTVGSSQYAESGMYTDILTSSMNCDSIVYLDLTVDPIQEMMLDVEICAGEMYEIGDEEFMETGNFSVIFSSAVTGCDSVVYLDLLVHTNPETFLDESICTDETYDVGTESFAATGSYQVVLSSSTGCDSTVFLNLSVAPCALTFTTENSSVGCNGAATGSIMFSMTQGVPPYTYNWLGEASGLSGNGMINQNFMATTLPDLPGDTYTITITDVNNVEVEISSEVTEPLPMNLQITPMQYGNFEISCQGAADGELTALATGANPPYQYNWSTGTTGANLQNIPAGTYTVTAIDSEGCERSQEITLAAPEEISMQLQAFEPDCFGESNGQIEITAVQGGNDPYLYTIDGGVYGSSNIFSQLPTGNYQISVQDVQGCEYTEDIFVNEPEQLLVDLGENIVMEYGELVHLEALTNRPVANYEWSGGELKNCETIDSTNCFNPIIAAAQSTSYTVLVTDDNGCTAEAQINVIIAKPRNVYIPTGFSPNGDGINDLFHMFGGTGVEHIRSFQVFNRWGEAVFEAYDFEPSSTIHAWDGSYRGQTLNAAVFVYMIEVEFLDGEVILYQGDVVLMR